MENIQHTSQPNSVSDAKKLYKILQCILVDEGINEKVDALAIEKGVLRREIWWLEVKLSHERNTNWVGERTAEADMANKQAAMTILEIKFALLAKEVDTISKSLEVFYDLSKTSIV